ncbi:MAG: hypothetical protein WCW84_07900 [Sulfurimonas sp.]|jgi:hypothetical protein
MQTKTTQELILKRRGITGTLEGGNENGHVEFSRSDNTEATTTFLRIILKDKNPRDIIRLHGIDETFDEIDKVLQVQVDRNHAMAYLIKSPGNYRNGEYPNDLYDACVVFSDYSQTFRTPVESYCIASVKEDGTLDFSCCDAAIRDAVMVKLSSLENSSKTLLDSVNNHAKWLYDRQGGDHVRTAWLLSEYLNGVDGIKSKRMTVKEFQSVYVHYVHGCPVYTTSKVEVA